MNKHVCRHCGHSFGVVNGECPNSYDCAGRCIFNHQGVAPVRFATLATAIARARRDGRALRVEIPLTERHQVVMVMPDGTCRHDSLRP